MRVPIFFILIFLFGCASKRERTEKFLNENPDVFAQLCAINFPVTEKIVPGKVITDTITVVLPGVEIPCPEYIDQDGQKKQPVVKCPDVETNQISTHKTDTIYRENTANVIRLQTENSLLKEKTKELNTTVGDLNKVAKMWKIIAAGIALLFICSIYIIIRK